MNRLLLKITITALSIALFFYYNPAPVKAAALHKKTMVGKSVAQWNYKRKITIGNNGNALSDAVIQIQFDSKEFDYTRAKEDGADIRFSTASVTMEADGLSYWIEQWNVDGITRIWVKVPVLKSHRQNTIYLFYGNSNARAVSNGNAAFLFFDDFEDGNYSKKGTTFLLAKSQSTAVC